MGCRPLTIDVENAAGVIDHEGDVAPLAIGDGTTVKAKTSGENVMGRVAEEPGAKAAFVAARRGL